MLEVFGELARSAAATTRGLRNDEKLRAALPQPLQLRDARVAVRRVMAGVGAVLALREMPAAAAVEPEQLVVALADDQHRRPGRNGVVHQLTARADQRVVVRRVSACAYGCPRRSPLRFPARADWRGTARRIRPVCGQPSDRRLAEVMDEHVFRAGDAEARAATRIEKSSSSNSPISNRSSSGPIASQTARRIAAQNIVAVRMSNAFAAACAPCCTRELLELAVGAVRHVDFGLVAGAVRHRPEQADPFVAEMRDEPVQPSGRPEWCRC